MPNPVAHLVLAALVWAAASFASPARSEDATTRPSPFALAATRAPDLSLRLRWTMADGTYLYRDRIAASSVDGSALPVMTAPGQTEDDPNFGPTEIYRGSTEATVPGAALAGLRAVRVTYQGCAEKGICYPPATRTLDLAAMAPPGSDRGAEGASAPGDPAGGRAVGPRPDVRPLGPDAPLVGNLLAVLSGMFGFGVLLAFTPCILPMVPILSGILVRAGGSLTPGRGFVLSGTYVVSMAAAYASLGLAAAWLGRNLQVALQTPLALGLMAATFVVLALSMFGLFDIQAPRRWRERTGAPASTGGSLPGAALLGFSSALVVGPCVTPPLAAALLYVARTGDVARGAMALFALGLGMGAPLVAVGTFGAGILPRSGPFLVRSKQAFGFVFLAVAVLLADRLLPARLSLLPWAALAVGSGLAVAALSGTGRPARLGRTVGVAAVAYGCALAAGAAVGGSDPLRPLSGVFRPETAMAAPDRTATTPADLEDALREARAQGKPALVEFAADWCTACKTNERTTLADAGIRTRLRRVAVIRADVTRDDEGTRALMRRFDVVGPPTLILFRADGTEVDGARAEGELSVDDLTRRLARAGA
jgi:thiol:disulfide interchange protein DsbD